MPSKKITKKAPAKKAPASAPSLSTETRALLEAAAELKEAALILRESFTAPEPSDGNGQRRSLSADDTPPAISTQISRMARASSTGSCNNPGPIKERFKIGGKVTRTHVLNRVYVMLYCLWGPGFDHESAILPEALRGGLLSPIRNIWFDDVGCTISDVSNYGTVNALVNAIHPKCVQRI